MKFPEKIELVLTQEDIDNGKKGMPSSCPLALAARRCQPDYPLSPAVGGRNVHFYKDEKGKRKAVYALPDEGVILVSLFDLFGDSHKRIKPQTLTITKVQEKY